MQRRRLTSPTSIAIACLTALLTASALSAETTVVVVRHAEKQAGGDPHLTAAGVERARALAEVASGVTAVYATETCRTAQTVQWLAKELGFTIRVQDFGEPGLSMDHCELAAPVSPLPAGVDGAEALAAHILAAERGGTVVVAGHSDTVPEIVEALGAGSLCPDYFPFLDNGECRIPDEGEASQYDNLFVITVPDGVQLIKAKYGD